MKTRCTNLEPAIGIIKIPGALKAKVHTTKTDQDPSVLVAEILGAQCVGRSPALGARLQDPYPDSVTK